MQAWKLRISKKNLNTFQFLQKYLKSNIEREHKNWNIH
jgi:hypothetical protein